ncbi:DUF3820 family protein [Mucilaginibacter litoreus]|uniref:DUF3820 family protein n=1 Tax=Mucilaginibacter litoreus TaxID=1048221 RepID=A0ABW3ASP4_9SPHI
MEDLTPNPQILVDIVNTRMPFGKYKDYLLCDVPISYLEWMYKKGFPQGKLGMMLSTVYEIKTNGVDKILREIKTRYGKR